MHGHNIERCLKLHSKIISNKGKEFVLHNPREIRGGKEDITILSNVQDNDEERRESISLRKAKIGYYLL